MGTVNLTITATPRSEKMMLAISRMADQELVIVIDFSVTHVCNRSGRSRRDHNPYKWIANPDLLRPQQIHIIRDYNSCLRRALEECKNKLLEWRGVTHVQTRSQ